MSTTPPPRIVAVLLLLILFGACVAAGLGTLGLVGPDEPRYAAVAREMAESGDWVTPRLHGQPWFEKPILYYWSGAAAMLALGDTETAARLPSVLAALLACIALAWAAQRTYNEATAYLFFLLLPATVAFIGFGRAATTDMMFSAMMTIALAGGSCVARCTGDEHPRRVSMISFGVFLGLATLAKGPAAVVLAGGAVLLWAALSGRWRAALRLAHLDVIIAYAVVTLPWYVLAALRHPDFVNVFLISHNFERFLTPVFRHEQPWWFYGPIVLLGVAPWTLLLLAPVRDALRAAVLGGWRNSPTLFYACWALFPIVFFSISKSKLPGYILPAIPALVLLTAHAVERSIGRGEWLARLLAVGTGLMFIGLAASAGYWAQRLPAESGVGAAAGGAPWLVGATLAGLLVAVLGAIKRTWAALGCAALTIAALVMAIQFLILPSLDRHLSARQAARETQHIGFGAEGICVFRVHRAWHYGLNYYLRRELPEWGPGAACAGLVFVPRANLHQLAQQSRRMDIIHEVSEQALLVRVELRQD